MKFMKNIFLSALMVIIGVGSVEASSAIIGATQQPQVCQLIDSLRGVFVVLRTLCFAGAAFVLMGWAWGFISGTTEVKLDEAKKKGVGMVIGFILLFTVGLITLFMPDIMGCNFVW